jgi:hypothetical protein
MNQRLKTFRDELQDVLLNFLWRQWSALGVAGQTGAEDEWIIDPEALLLFTSTIGRYEPRLFDEVLDWLQENGSFINILRLKRIQQMEHLGSPHVLSAIAATLSKGTDVLKWKQLAEREASNQISPEPLFRHRDGTQLPAPGEPEHQFARYGLLRGPLRLRGYSQRFRPTQQTNLALQLRALLGINVRCEIVMYLLTHEAAHAAEIAREAYYFGRAVQNTLVDMSRSGVVQIRPVGREKHYWLKPEVWAPLLNRGEVFPKWITWPPLFSALERVWTKLNEPKLWNLDPLLQSSELRRLMSEIRPAMERARFDKALSDDREYLGEKYLPVFMSDVINLLG